MEYNTKSDVEILRESLANPASFAALVERYQGAFLRKAGHILRNADEAEDAVQDSFVKIYVGAKKFKEQPGASFSSWAYKILVNTCLTRYRKLRRQHSAIFNLDERELEVLAPRSLLDQRSLGEVGGEVGDWHTRLDYLVSLIPTLPAVLRRAITGYGLEGWSYEDLAAAEAISPGAARTRVSRARRLLSIKIKNDDANRNF